MRAYFSIVTQIPRWPGSRKIFAAALCYLLLFVSIPRAAAQGGIIQGVAQGTAVINGITAIVPVPGATITVCSTARVQSASESGTTVTLTFYTPHGFTQGQAVSVYGLGGYNGGFSVATVPTSTTLTYIAVASGLSSSSGVGAVAPSATPCTPLATLYTDETLVATRSNPVTADAGGNYTIYTGPGIYILQVAGTGLATFSEVVQVGGVIPAIDNPTYFGGTVSGKRIGSIFQADRWGIKGDAALGALSQATDNTANWNTLTAAAQAWAGNANTGAVIHLPAGAYRFASRPGALPANVSVEGDGRETTWIIADYTPANDTDAFFTMQSGPNHLTGFKMFTGSGATGTAIKFLTQSCSVRAGFSYVDHVDLNFTFTTTGWWAHHIIIDGSACTDPSSIGERDIKLSDMYLAGTKASTAATFTGYGIVVWAGVHIAFDHIATFVPIAPDTTEDVLISGPSSAVKSQAVTGTNLDLISNMTIDQALEVTLSGLLTGSLSTTANADLIHWSGPVVGAVNIATVDEVIVDDPVNGSWHANPNMNSRKALFKGLTAGDTLAFGHNNPDFFSTIGAFSGGGNPQFCFFCYASPNASQYRYSGTTNAPIQMFVSPGSNNAIEFRAQSVGTTDVDISWNPPFWAFFKAGVSGWGEQTTALASQTGFDVCGGNGNTHQLQCGYNGGAFFSMTQTIGTGNVTTAGTAVSAGTTQDQTGISITGSLVSDTCTASIPAALPATWQTGIIPRCDITTAGTATVHLTNPTAGSITPAAQQVNVRITR